MLFAGVALLFTTRYPGGLFDLVVGLDRWVGRVAAYVLLMRDEYPPFRLEQGGVEGEGLAEPTPTVAGRLAVPRAGRTGRAACRRLGPGDESRWWSSGR